MSDRCERVRSAYESFDKGDAAELTELFAKEAQWLGVPGGGEFAHELLEAP